MSIDMFKLSGYTSDKAVEMLAPIKYKMPSLKDKLLSVIR
jgi:hypothetical protein